MNNRDHEVFEDLMSYTLRLVPAVGRRYLSVFYLSRNAGSHILITLF